MSSDPNLEKLCLVTYVNVTLSHSGTQVIDYFQISRITPCIQFPREYPDY